MDRPRHFAIFCCIFLGLIGPNARSNPADQQLLSVDTSTLNKGSRALRTKLSLTAEELLRFNDDFRRLHEASPEGVPGGYDWYSRPKRGSWNSAPSNYSALTGWGQAFWAKGTTSADARLLLRNLMTLVCQGDGQWFLVQSSAQVGANFRADFVGNEAIRAQSVDVPENDVSAVEVVPGRAYHFWPRAARATVPKQKLCGILVLVQAKAEPITRNSYLKPNMLLGLGADYWLDKTAQWDNYKTNRDVAIGRLKFVHTSWAWFGLSTASDEDLQKLADDGYLNAR